MSGVLHINEIELDYRPREQILPQISIIDDEPEMTPFESAFLCGLLNRFKPDSILEVGIAGGATSAIILQCMSNIGRRFVMYSHDYSERFYRDATRQSGFLAGEAISILDDDLFEHKLFLGGWRAIIGASFSEILIFC